jgi:hypothetical protein
MISSAGAGLDAKMLPCTARPGTRKAVWWSYDQPLSCIMSPNGTRMDYLSFLDNLSTTAPAFLLQSLLGLSASPLPEKLIRATCSNELSLLERILKIRAISKLRVEQITLAFCFGQT